MILNIMFVFVALIFATIQYMILRQKITSIIRSGGYSCMRLIIYHIKELFFEVLKFFIPFSLFYGLYILSKDSKMVFFYLELVQVLIILILFVVIGIIITLGIIIQIFKTENYTHLKGKKDKFNIQLMNIMLKTIFIAFILFTFSFLIKSMDVIRIQSRLNENWKYTENVYRLGYTLNTRTPTREDEYKMGVADKNFFKKMQENSRGFIINSSNFLELGNNQYSYDINSKEDSRIDEYGQNITADLEYFKYNPFTTNEEYEYIKSKIIDDDITRNILVPKKYQEFEEKIRENYLNLFYYQKIEVANLYNEELKKNLDIRTKNDLKINIIYVDEAKYFTFNLEIAKSNGNIVEDSIVIIETGNIDGSYITAHLTTNYFLKTTLPNPIDEITSIKKQVNQFGVGRPVSLYNENAQKIDNLKNDIAKQTLLLTVLIISTLIVIYNWIAIYYERNKLQLFVKKIFGYSNFKIKKNLYLSSFLTTIIPIFLVLIYNPNILPFSIVIIVLEILLMFIIERKLKRSMFSKIMKGEK